MITSRNSQDSHLRDDRRHSSVMSNARSLIGVMKIQESSVYKPCDYLGEGAVLDSFVTSQDRCLLCQWGFELIDACGIDRVVVSSAITYFDRFLSSRGLKVVEICLSRRREFQLAFITCLVLSLKAREGIQVESSFITSSLCDDMYHIEEVVEMELQILSTLGWRLNGPTTHDFIHCFADLAPRTWDKSTVDSCVRAALAQAETALLDYHMALELPSIVALASIAGCSRSGGIRPCGMDISPWLDRIQDALNCDEIVAIHPGPASFESSCLSLHVISDED